MAAAVEESDVMAAAVEESEVMAELEAVRAVYGDDCRVICDQFPLHFTVHVRPRTADISAEQFVEAVVGMEASSKYPHEPPLIYVVDSKGLDDKRQRHLISTVRSKSRELSSTFMFVSLFEEAVEMLSSMNYPDGECPLCLYPLFPENKKCTLLPFMKLMSCFHCFHSKCISRWWHWLQQQNASLEVERGSAADQQLASCPVCRKNFDSKDIEHVLNLVETGLSPLIQEEIDSADEKDILQCDTEKIRREKFEYLLETQRNSSGLFEPRKPISISPGMFLPQSQIPSVDRCVEEVAPVPAVDDTISGVSNDKSTTRVHKNPSIRRSRGRTFPKRDSQPSKRWIPKGDGM